jgi:hypothetical protein
MDGRIVSSGDPGQSEESRTECQEAVPCKFFDMIDLLCFAVHALECFGSW